MEVNDGISLRGLSYCIDTRFDVRRQKLEHYFRSSGKSSEAPGQEPGSASIIDIRSAGKEKKGKESSRVVSIKMDNNKIKARGSRFNVIREETRGKFEKFL